MSPVNQYKNWEYQVSRKVRRRFRGVFGTIGEALGRLWALGRQNLTILLIPDSEQKIINFKISVFALTFLAVLGVSVIGAVLWYSTNFTGTNRLLAQKSDHLEAAQTNLDLVREEVAQLKSSSRLFEDSLNSAMGVIGMSVPRTSPGAQAQGDLSSLLGLEPVDQ